MFSIRACAAAAAAAAATEVPGLYSSAVTTWVVRQFGRYGDLCCCGIRDESGTGFWSVLRGPMCGIHVSVLLLLGHGLFPILFL